MKAIIECSGRIILKCPNPRCDSWGCARCDNQKIEANILEDQEGNEVEVEDNE